MELFYAKETAGGIATLDKEESGHCVRVLRHRAGDEISVIDGMGTLFRCELTEASAHEARAKVLSSVPGFGSHDYTLTLAVCPPKNMERFEWFIEKATEFGIDNILPIIGDHSERKVVKTDRLRRIILSATKQSLKAKLPVLAEPVSFKEFITTPAATGWLKLICCCFEPQMKRVPVMEALAEVPQSTPIVFLIGPEGDFSEEEVALATDCGWIPVHLGSSRLRVETAALAAVSAVYLTHEGFPPLPEDPTL